MAGLHGLGAKLTVTALTTIWSTAAGAYLSTSHDLIELTNIGEVNMTADDIDVSSFANRVKQYVKGLIEPGEASFEGNFLTTDAPKVKTYLESQGSTYQQRITVPGKFLVTFPGYVRAFSFGIPYDGKISMNGGIKIAGTATFYTSTST
jgi:hypothetical protein